MSWDQREYDKPCGGTKGSMKSLRGGMKGSMKSPCGGSKGSMRSPLGGIKGSAGFNDFFIEEFHIFYPAPLEEGGGQISEFAHVLAVFPGSHSGKWHEGGGGRKTCRCWLQDHS